MQLCTNQEREMFTSFSSTDREMIYHLGCSPGTRNSKARAGVTSVPILRNPIFTLILIYFFLETCISEFLKFQIVFKPELIEETKTTK